ncbi:hypothetical protein AAHE18_03G149500 [Arachis hypogaea]
MKYIVSINRGKNFHNNIILIFSVAKYTHLEQYLAIYRRLEIPSKKVFFEVSTCFLREFPINYIWSMVSGKSLLFSSPTYSPLSPQSHDLFIVGLLRPKF